MFSKKGKIQCAKCFFCSGDSLHYRNFRLRLFSPLHSFLCKMLVILLMNCSVNLCWPIIFRIWILNYEFHLRSIVKYHYYFWVFGNTYLIYHHIVRCLLGGLMNYIFWTELNSLIRYSFFHDNRFCLKLRRQFL